MDFLPGWIFPARGGAFKAVSSSVPGKFAQTGLLQLAAFSFRTIKSWSGFAGDV
jgi:hypothetical protein